MSTNVPRTAPGVPGMVTVKASRSPRRHEPMSTRNTSLPYGATSPSGRSVLTPARVPRRNGSPTCVDATPHRWANSVIALVPLPHISASDPSALR